MRLADFIRSNREPILSEWQAFALSCAPASGPMDTTALRDHAGDMLDAIAQDLDEPQTGLAQAEKSKGHAPEEADAATTAAREHGAGRAQSGFTVEQMVAEYRALRASVIRLWTRSEGSLDATDIEDLTRFNESIDQSLAESVGRFNHDVQQAKETFLAMLGHDLRAPLGAIQTSATFLLETGGLEGTSRMLTERIVGSARRSVSMVGDLLDFTRSRLGDGIPVARADTDLGAVAREVVAEISAASPESHINLDVRSAQHGLWDSARLSQALANLIGNAVQHGAADATVEVTVDGSDTEGTVAVHNRGAVIPPEQLDGLFNPMRSRRPARTPSPGPTGSLGLGLFIAERIISAHGGHLEARSTAAEGTTFTVHLPRGA